MNVFMAFSLKRNKVLVNKTATGGGGEGKKKKKQSLSLGDLKFLFISDRKSQSRI